MNIDYETKLEQISNKYPFNYTDTITLYLDNVICVDKDKYKVDIHDNHGYRYRYDHGYIIKAKLNGYTLTRFFKRNPHTCYNIQKYLEINRIPLTLISDDLYSGGAMESLKFVGEDGEIKYIKWNDLQQNPNRYRDDYDDFLEMKKQSRMISKEDATKIILQMQANLNRPLVQDDFSNPNKERLGIKIVERIWGSLHEMQKELGLTITGKYAKKVDDKNYKELIKNVCDNVFRCENRKTLVVNDFKKYGVALISAYHRTCKNNNTTLHNELNRYGFTLQRAGNGFNYIYEDGERVTSMYEYEFSNLLKSFGFEYNKDYFRNVKYKELTNTYTGNMNCDYKLCINGRIIYVELAGMIGNPLHEVCYNNNLPINSKSKEKYRLDLMRKKEIFELENLEYYILLKSDMNENTYLKLLHKLTQEVA